MAKVITKRDMVVVRVISELIPDVAWITITRYTGNDPNAPEYKMAYVRVPGVLDEVAVKLWRARLCGGHVQWMPLWVAVPGNDKPGAIYKIMQGLGPRFMFIKR